VVVGYDIALRRDDYARACSGTVLLEFATTCAWAVKELLKRVALKGRLYDFGGDVNNRVDGIFCGGCEV